MTQAGLEKHHQNILQTALTSPDHWNVITGTYNGVPVICVFSNHDDYYNFNPEDLRVVTFLALWQKPILKNGSPDCPLSPVYAGVLDYVGFNGFFLAFQ